MRQKLCGGSGLRLSELTLGAAGWGTRTSETEAAEILREYLDAGGTCIDTAPTYGQGQSEAILGELVGALVPRQDVVLISKAGLRQVGNTSTPDASRRTLLADLDATLSRLNTNELDLWLVHTWDDQTPLEETLSALEFAYTSGRARYVGISNFTGWQLAKAAALSRVPLTATQNEYSLLNRTCEDDVIPAAVDAQMGVLAWGALGRGVLSGKYRGQIPADSSGAQEASADYVAPYLHGAPAHVVEAVVTAANGLDRNALDISLAWLLARPGVSSAVVGPRNGMQARELFSMEFSPLPTQISTALGDVSY